jgi:hypothetical protein
MLFGHLRDDGSPMPPFAKVRLTQSASFSMRRSPIWVIRVALTARRSLPVFLD